MKYAIIPVVLAIMLSACNNTRKQRSLADSLHVADGQLKTIAPAQLIVPGKNIGDIYINADAGSLPEKLGKPDFSDAAMGASLIAWHTENKDGGEISVYSHRNMGMADEAISHIKEIRTTSPRFKTADYAGAGSELKDVIKIYKLKPRNLSASANKKTVLYNDYEKGIGFEVDSTGKCIAVRIYAPGDSAVTYINMQH